MASSFEKSVKGATKIKLAPPKSKYIEHILIATHSGDHGIAEIFRALQPRLRDSTWTVVFKALITVHLMIREGEPDVTLRYLSDNPKNKLAISNFTEVQTQGRNIRSYSGYLQKRAAAYNRTKVDYVRNGEGRLKKASIDKGLLMETEVVQRQIEALLRCDVVSPPMYEDPRSFRQFLTDDAENEITLFAFRLLTMDLLALFHVMNEGMLNVLEHYFECSKPDAERAIDIYKTFCRQTDKTVQFLATARHFEHLTRLEIPKIKHAPTSLATSLEDYLHDKDFEINRRQYLAQQEAKRRSGRGGTSDGLKMFTEKASSSTPTRTTAPQSFPEPKAASAAPSQAQPKGPAPDLIDFFDSIESNQQSMQQPSAQFNYGQQYQQQGFQGQQAGFAQQPTGFPQQQQAFGGPSSTNPFGGFGQQQPSELQGQSRPAELFGGSLPQELQAQQQPAPLQPDFTGAGFGGYTPQTQPSFSSSLSSIPQNGATSFAPQQQAASTGSTNPFRQSMFPQSTGATTATFGSSGPMSPASNPNRMSTNPFKRDSPAAAQAFSPPPLPQQQQTGFQPQSQFGQQQQAQQSDSPFAPLHGQPTGTNPFKHANTFPASPTGAGGLAPLAPSATGSTNPFRQSAFVNQQTGQGWQNNPQSQGMFGGQSLNNVDTQQIFPRPGQG